MENFLNHKDVQVLNYTKVWRNAEIINYDEEKLEFTVKFKNFTPKHSGSEILLKGWKPKRLQKHLEKRQIRHHERRQSRHKNTNCLCQLIRGGILLI